MDKFFDKLAELLRSVLGSDSTSSWYYDEQDPDMRAAVEELDAFLNDEGLAEESGAGGGGYGGGREGARFREAPFRADESLRRDYATLEVAFGASLEETRRSYKRLLHKYHPDRFNQDPERQKLATEVTQRLNQAFDRIEAHQNRRRP